MAEVLLLLLVVYVVPITVGSWWLGILVLLITLPGLYATVTGVHYQPTLPRTQDRMMGLAAITAGQKVYDLGCGDGRLVFAAAKRGARAVGYELSIPVFFIAWLRSLRVLGASIRFGNFWKKDYSDADVIFCFLLDPAMVRVRDVIWPQLKPGCKLVSHYFALPSHEPDAKDGNVVMYVKK